MPQVTLRFHHSLWPERSRAVGESQPPEIYISRHINIPPPKLRSHSQTIRYRRSGKDHLKMATASQIDANTQNAQRSTGPRTEAGKTASSRSAVTNGLYSKEPYVKPEDISYYRQFSAAMHAA